MFKMRQFVKSFKVLGVCFWMCVALGLASAEFQPATPEEGQAVVYLYHPSEFFSDGEHNLVALNEKVVAEIEAGSYFVQTIPLGRTIVTRKLTSAFGMLSPSSHIGLWEGFVEVEGFIARGGRRYYVRFPEGVYVEEEEALEELEDLKLLEPYKE